jgi:sterol 24-C-methyltransferase
MGMIKLCTSVMVLLAAIAIGSTGLIFQQSPAVMWYRFSTSMKALYALYTLPQEHVDRFLKSYELFEKENYTGSDDAANIVGYYQVINHLCAIGDVEKMYIPPVLDLDLGVFGNQMLWEEKGLADKLDVEKGKKVLEVGCGRGRIAHHVAKYTGAKVVGLNIDKSQIKMAEDYAKAEGMHGSQLEFVEANFNKPFPFEDGTFDGMYHVQALTYVQDLDVFLKELSRVLKPGAKISFLDWFRLESYQPEDPYHRKLLQDTKAVIGAVRTPAPEEYNVALKRAGFEVIFSGEASADGGHQWPLVMQADQFYTTAKAVVDFLTEWKVIPGHLKVLLERLVYGGKSFVEADKLGLFTTSWQIIAQKPK